MKTFAEVFGGQPEVTAEAHGRVNLLGEHTDYNDGYVLPTAIPQQTRIALRRSQSPSFCVYSANLDETARFAPDTMPQDQFARYVYGCVQQLVQHFGPVPPLDIYVESDVPMEVGLSSSAALEVAVLRALAELQQLGVDRVQIARLAQRAEIDFAGVNCGILDQMAASLLDPGSMLFLDTRTLQSSLLPLPENTEILIVDSGIARSLATSKYNERRQECEEAAQRLGCAALRDVHDPAVVESLAQPWQRRARHVVTENARVLQAAKGVSAAEFGDLMNASHSSLRDDYEVSVPDLDDLVALLQSQPAVHGAKLTGAGFGGACVALCRSGAASEAGEAVLRTYNTPGSRTGRILVPFVGNA